MSAIDSAQQRGSLLAVRTAQQALPYQRPSPRPSGLPKAESARVENPRAETSRQKMIRPDHVLSRRPEVGSTFFHGVRSSESLASKFAGRVQWGGDGLVP